MWHQKIVSLGRASEFYGEEYINCDLFMRTLNMQPLSVELLNNSDSYTKEVIQSYTNGINHYITEAKVQFSVEFDAIGIIPER